MMLLKLTYNTWDVVHLIQCRCSTELYSLGGYNPYLHSLFSGHFYKKMLRGNKTKICIHVCCCHDCAVPDLCMDRKHVAKQEEVYPHQPIRIKRCSVNPNCNIPETQLELPSITAVFHGDYGKTHHLHTETRVFTLQWERLVFQPRY